MGCAVIVDAGEPGQREQPGPAGIDGPDPNRLRPVAGELTPGGLFDVVVAQGLIDTIGAERSIHRGAVAGRQLSIDPVDQCLVRLPSADEPDGMVLGPGPGWSVRGRSSEVPSQGATCPVEVRQQPVATGGPLLADKGLDVGVRCQPTTHDRAPEPLDLRQVP